MRTLLFLSLTLFFFSCEKNEIPVSKPATSANVKQVNMGSDYANQLFFSLDQQAVISQNNREIWDLGFESGADGWHIVLNGSKLMAAGKTTETALASVTQSDGTTWNWDRPSGLKDSTAVGDWRNDALVYIIDRGNSITGTPLGMVKIIFHSVNAQEYTIEWADLTASTSHLYTIPKSNDHNYTFFSFANGGQMASVEPPKTDWELCFTSYTHVFDAHTPYLVTGVTGNSSGVLLAEVSNGATFDQIDYNACMNTTFSDHLNIIGYSWKVYDFTLSTYTVNSNRTFLVKNHENRYFKLRFLDFYDVNGLKGAPSFELQELIP